MKSCFLLPVFLFFFFVSLSAQSLPVSGNEGNALMLRMSYGIQFPGADLADRFGYNGSLGIGLDYLTRSNWIAGLETQFLFGNAVDINPLESLTNSAGFIYSQDGGVAMLGLRQRGFYLGGLVGKLFALSEKNKRSGIRLTLGAGLLQHKIRIQEDPQAFVPQIAGEYKKGYDRLANGLALHQTLSYQFHSKNRRINLILGVEALQGFTAPRRNWNIDEMQAETGNRLDLLFGARLTWILPFYLVENPDEIFY